MSGPLTGPPEPGRDPDPGAGPPEGSGFDPSFPARLEEDTLARSISRGIAGVTALGVAGLTVPPWVSILSGAAEVTRFGAAWIGFGSVAAAMLGFFALAGASPRARELARRSLVGAVVLGGVSFAAGFLGPIILMPEANQGPLLGILVTGPAGAAVGAVIGFVSGLVRRGD